MVGCFQGFSHLGFRVCLAASILTILAPVIMLMATMVKESNAFVVGCEGKAGRPMHSKLIHDGSEIDHYRAKP